MNSDIQTFLSQDIQLEAEIGAVVIGFDEFISYPKMFKAANYLTNQDCLFLATNNDETFPVENQLKVPGTGTMVAAISTCSLRKPDIFGKPFKSMFEMISNMANILPHRTLMVGDR